MDYLVCAGFPFGRDSFPYGAYLKKDLVEQPSMCESKKTSTGRS